MNVEVAWQVLRNRSLAYAVTDSELRVVEARDATGLLAGEGEGCVGCSLFDLVPELIGSEDALVAILTGDLPRYQLDWVNRSGGAHKTLYLNLSVLPHRRYAGQHGTAEIDGVLCVVEDITERGELQQRLVQHHHELRLAQREVEDKNLVLDAANVELRRLDDTKSMFVSVAAHELRTPLSAIKGYVELLLEGAFGELNSEQRGSLDVVRRSADRLLNITNTLLDVTRLETGRVNLILESVDLRQVVAKVSGELQDELTARAQVLQVNATPGLPPAHCDPARAHQMIGHLLDNASKYSPTGGVIEIRLARADEPGFLQVAISDSGVGISISEQARLFTRFYRAEAASLSNATGVGLGLYIVRALAHLHGGRIWLESTPGRGSTFFFTLPMAVSP